MMLSLRAHHKRSLALPDQQLDSLVSSAQAPMAEVEMIAGHNSMRSAAPGFSIIFSCAPLVSSHISALDSPGQPLLLAICSNVEFRKSSFSLARVGFPSLPIASLIAALQIVASSSADAPDISLAPQPLLPAGRLTALPPKPPQNVAAGTCSRTPTSSTAGSGCMPLDAPPPMHTSDSLPSQSTALNPFRTARRGVQAHQVVKNEGEELEELEELEVWCWGMEYASLCCSDR
jgi:hypothetical protein